ncbi:MAG: alanine dehydrogenase [Candidatus Marinimicrobia bacterium]|nr:alanine dehydrogenase [Candidatus Neomarinimicrobiota bacterium]MCF7850652.1 alanine dehydrogenase [Candidatus Neomarinimicrobiota bacterium]MCF7905099.1 alanine dehydrogenase [Candidatus Neomarinimicrobiota bacterium]
MIVGLPKEIKTNENRIAMTPGGVELLVKSGHTVIVEDNCGLNSGFTNEQYVNAGASIEKDIDKLWQRAEMIVKVKEPQPVEIARSREGQIVFTYFHFAADKDLTLGFLKTNAWAVAYETVENKRGKLPLLEPMSEVAGRMATQEGARILEHINGGRGILLGGVPGVHPATVLVLGGGIVGTQATKIAAGMGAHVYIMDIDLDRLRELDDIMPENVTTLYSSPANIRELLPKVDLVVGAVLLPGAKAPNLITREMLSIMKDRSVIVDVAVDQGGCVETCKPTTHENPTFVVDGVVHYCVANMPGAVPYTSTIALTNATLPYVLKLANNGVEAALKADDGFALGLNMVNGKVTCEAVANAFDLEYTPLSEVLG